jgi:hypothetical protein
MKSTKERDDLMYEEFSLVQRELPKGTKITSIGKSEQNGKPFFTHMTIQFESDDDKLANKFTKMKYYTSTHRDDFDKYVWRISFVRNY